MSYGKNVIDIQYSIYIYIQVYKETIMESSAMY